MPIITIPFSNPLNTSVQVGDVAYYVNTTTTGGFTTQNLANVNEIGPITSITPWNGISSSITCNSPGPPYPVQGSFIMFSKDNKVNMSSILGYYAEVEFRNNSTKEAELFSVGTEIFESSK